MPVLALEATPILAALLALAAGVLGWLLGRQRAHPAAMLTLSLLIALAVTVVCWPDVPPCA
jgi:ABC-type branched-subunit amino acid transport system permease subunit